MLVIVSIQPRRVFGDEPAPTAHRSWRLAHDVGFTGSELSLAISARTLDNATELPCSTIDIRREGIDTLLVLCGDSGRVVELGEQSGADAARIVAIVLIDLAQGTRGDAAPPEQARPSLPSTLESLDMSAAKIAPSSQRIVANKTPYPRLELRGLLGLFVGLGLQGSDVFMRGIVAGAEIHSDHLLAGTELRYASSNDRPQTSLAPSVAQRSLRVFVGGKFARFRVSAAANASRVSVGRTVDYSRTLFAGGLTVGRGLKLAEGVWLLLSADLEVYSRRVVVRAASLKLLSSPRANVNLNASLMWRFGAR